MKKYLIASLLLALCRSHVARAADLEDIMPKFAEDVKRVSGLCQSGAAQYRRQGEQLIPFGNEPPHDWSTIWSQRYVDWTGGCIDGKRDGIGSLTVVYEMVSVEPGLMPSSNAHAVMVGSFVRGRQLGIWCTTSSATTGVTFSAQPIGCRILGETSTSLFYRKEADGRWRALDDMGGISEPAAFLEAGALEKESARLLSDARAGRKSAPVTLVAQSPMIEELVSGGHVTMAINRDPLGLKTKRVAIVLTSQSLREFDRFRRMRQALIDATSKDAKTLPSRDAFISRSNPDNLIAGIAAAVRAKSLGISAADDLSVLKAGLADYVLLFDWKFTENFNLSPKDYKVLRKCSYDPSQDFVVYVNGCPTFYKESGSALLVDEKRNAVRQFDLGGFDGIINSNAGLPYDYHSKCKNRCGYDEMLQMLAEGFKGKWSLELGDFGRHLTAYLEAEE